MQPLNKKSKRPYRFWDEDDFDKQFDLFAKQAEPVLPQQRILKCYFEGEEEHVLKKSNVSKAKFLQKYGSVEFDEIDNAGTHYKIHSSKMHFQRQTKMTQVDGV